MYRFFATIRSGGQSALSHSPPSFATPLFIFLFCVLPRSASPFGAAALMMEGKGFRGLPICNCNRRTGNMTGERNLRMHRFYPSPSRSPSSGLPCYFSTVSPTPLSSWNCSSEMQEILRAREAAARAAEAVVGRKRAGKQIPHLQNDRRGESARTRGSTLACMYYVAL